MRVTRTLSWIAAAAITASATGQFDSGSDGSDGPFNPFNLETVIDLSLAVTAAWDTPSPFPGQGVYDPEKWAIVFKYTTINIPPGVTVSFLNHPSGAPVVWLTTGNVTMQGSVVLDGQDYLNGGGQSFVYSIPGPGGFAGGAGLSGGLPASGGFGPGGGAVGAGGSYNYGNPNIIPLIGGSGGGGWGNFTWTGGAGGGAILLASSGNITLLSGSNILARGGGGDSNLGGAAMGRFV